MLREWSPNRRAGSRHCGSSNPGTFRMSQAGVLGAGERLFGVTSGKKPMRLVDVITIGDGLTLVTHEAVKGA